MGSLTPEAFGYRLVELLPQLMREISRNENNYVTKGKITCQQFLVLEFLSPHESCKMHELAKSMQISFSTATGMVDRLVKHGLARRFRPEDDRRNVLVSITNKGKKILDEIHEQKRKGIITLFGRLSALERSRYLEIIEKLVVNLSANKSK